MTNSLFFSVKTLRSLEGVCCTVAALPVNCLAASRFISWLTAGTLFFGHGAAHHMTGVWFGVGRPYSKLFSSHCALGRIHPDPPLVNGNNLVRSLLKLLNSGSYPPFFVCCTHRGRDNDNKLHYMYHRSQNILTGCGQLATQSSMKFRESSLSPGHRTPDYRHMCLPSTTTGM